eukprot:g12997.t1
MSDPHPGDFARAPAAPSTLGVTTAGEAEEEEREPGALAPRQLPGNYLSEAAGAAASGAFSTPSVDFGFGNSWSHIPIPIPLGDNFDAHHHRHSPHHDEETAGLHKSQGGSSGLAGGNGSPGAAGRRSDDDRIMSDSPHPGAAAAAVSAAAQKARGFEEAHQPAASAAAEAAAGAGAGGLDPTLPYTRNASSTNSPAEEDQGERCHAHGSSVSSRIGGEAPQGSASPREGSRPSTPTELVSLPDDIYGAARVSEYWHGVPGLSSLASTYVYDDIWAGGASSKRGNQDAQKLPNL